MPLLRGRDVLLGQLSPLPADSARPLMGLTREHLNDVLVQKASGSCVHGFIYEILGAWVAHCRWVSHCESPLVRRGIGARWCAHLPILPRSEERMRSVPDVQMITHHADLPR